MLRDLRLMSAKSDLGIYINGSVYFARDFLRENIFAVKLAVFVIEKVHVSPVAPRQRECTNSAWPRREAWHLVAERRRYRVIAERSSLSRFLAKLRADHRDPSRAR